MKAPTRKFSIQQNIRQKRSAYELQRRRDFIARGKTRRIIAPTPILDRYQQNAQADMVVVPEILDFEEHRDDVLSLARRCRSNTFKRRRRLILDFRHTKRISSTAILYLVAEIYRCREIGGKASVTGTYPQDKKLHKQMRDSGFFDVLGVKSGMEEEQERVYPLEYIKVMAGQGAQGALAIELRKKLLGQYADDMKPNTPEAFFRGLSEAMTNVAQHAYPDNYVFPVVKPIPKAWWMLGHINKPKKELKIMIVDQGIGIPRSLPLKYPLEFVQELLSLFGVIKPTDGDLISAAMMVGRSRMNLSHRGKGLNDLRKIIDLCGSGTLRILSNRGEYKYTNNKKEMISAYQYSLCGTLIEWSVPLHTVLNLEMEDVQNDQSR